MLYAEIEQKINSKNGNEILLLSKTPDKFEKTILFIGVFHGDEPSGEYLITRYLSQKDMPANKNRLLFIPCLNPDGKKQNTRWNANKVDLNRNFPTKNWELIDENDSYYGGSKPASELETQFMIYVIEKHKPDLIISFHEPYTIVNYDGPAQNIAQDISNLTGYKTEENIGYPTPGSFGTYCGIERNIPTITLELPENEDQEILWNTNKNIFTYTQDI